jgi:hypothetical protein
VGETLVKASAYRVTNDIEKGENCWLVQHTKRLEKIVWGQHQFQVYVNKETGEFTCECKTWETQVRPCMNICMLILLEYMTPCFTF